LEKSLSDFLEEFPFTSAGVIAQNFDLSELRIKDIVEREFWLRRFSRIWLPHSLSESQKADRVAMASGLLTLLRGQVLFSFSRIVTGNESWFLYLYQTDHMFAVSRDDVILRKKSTIGARKVMMTIFFSGAKLISRWAFPAGAEFTQEYFIDTILPDIIHERGQIFRRVHCGDSFVHMDNSMCHNCRKVTDKLEVLRPDRVHHSPYSPDLSPCDFWLFGMLK
jgi:histone-lysine N-methyltransferase SETMAR